MATVPNYYYNSPAIADVGRNLASALAPPDPEKTIARQRAQWEYDRMQQLARIQDQDRADKAAADQGLVDLYSDPEAVNPVTGEVDEKQTGINRRNIASRALAGGREYVAPVDELLGPYSQKFASMQILEAVKAAATEAAIQERFGGQMQIAQYNQGQMNTRQDKVFGHDFSMEAFKQSGRFQLQNAHAQQRLAEIQERARTSGGNPMKITGKALEDLLTYMQMKIQDSGAQMPQGYQDELLTRMAINASKSGNIPLAVEEEWAASGLPQGSTEEEQPGTISSLLHHWGIGSTPRTLTPNFGPRADAPSLGGGSSSTQTTTKLGGVVAPQGMSQADYDLALNKTIQTGQPPDLSSALSSVQVPQLGPAPVQAPAQAPAPAPNKAATANAGPLPKPKNKREFDALKKGAHFLDPNNEERIKP